MPHSHSLQPIVKRVSLLVRTQSSMWLTDTIIYRELI